MNKKNLFLKTLFILFFLKFFDLKAIENKIIVTVDNEPITSYELKNKILTQLILSNQEINQKIIDQTKDPALNYLINLKLKKNEILNKKIKIDQQNFNQNLNKIANNDIINFKSKFKDNSIDYDLFLEELKIELSWQKLIYSLFKNKVNIEDNVIDEELKKIKSNNENTFEFRLFEIELNLDENDKNKINAVFNDIKLLGFEAAAKKHSVSTTAKNNGDLGWISEKILSKQILNKINKLEINEISELIKRQNSLLILKVKDKRKLKIDDKNLKTIKERLVDQKANELFRQYSNNHLSKIKSNSLIKFK